MPLFYQNNINEVTRLAIWKIDEPEEFFLDYVPIKRDISHPNKRRQHLAGRFLLPFLFEDFPNREIVVADTRKPYLPGEQYHFSISHGGDYAAAIVSKNQRVGIDIEAFNSKFIRIKEKYLSEAEILLAMSNGQLDIQKLTLLWNAKEAIYKWWSYGQISLKDNIHIQTIKDEQTLIADLRTSGQINNLTTQFLCFDQISVCWIATP